GDPPQPGLSWRSTTEPASASHSGQPPQSNRSPSPEPSTRTMPGRGPVAPAGMRMIAPRSPTAVGTTVSVSTAVGGEVVGGTVMSGLLGVGVGGGAGQQDADEPVVRRSGGAISDPGEVRLDHGGQLGADGGQLGGGQRQRRPAEESGLPP